MTPEEAFKHGVEAGEKIAALKVKLREARYTRKHLDYGPLIVRNDALPDDERDRWATPEETTGWKTDADAKISDLETQIADLLKYPG